MNDQSEPSAARLNLSPDGRKIFVWVGQDRKADIDELTAAIAATGELYNDNGRLVQLRDGELIPVNLADFRKLIDNHICGERVVRKGTGWVREFFTYQFLPAARFDASLSGPQPPADTSEPDDAAREQIYRTELLPRIPKARG